VRRPVLEVSDLHVAYGIVEAVRGVSLTVGRGEIVTVIGANGAGKSTLLNAIMGILPTRGKISFLGQTLNRLPVEARVAAGLCLVPERRELFSSMSVEDNLRLGAYRARHPNRPSFDGIFDLFPRLKERRRQQAATLSGGERQMLAIGRALMGGPRLLMLDEPSLGLAPLIARDIFGVISDLSKTGVAILLVEQNARAAFQISDRGLVLDNGISVRSGTSAELEVDEGIVETYLGLTRAHPQSQ
jgi:branched-chain amino acid transport system ATP-binding protein